MKTYLSKTILMVVKLLIKSCCFKWIRLYAEADVEKVTVIQEMGSPLNAIVVIDSLG